MTTSNAIESAPATEPYRPRLHFSPAAGWLNDPNGLVFVDGRYHAFYQHEPHGTVHGPMHWGHAVSEDLVHWEELPVALHPDELGECFSGSAVLTPDGGIALFYTAHLEREGRDALQTQCLVRCDRALTRFEREPGNPVLGNARALRDFRDPKVFRHAPTRRWIMVLTHGRCAGFFASEDLASWTPLGEFGLDAGAPGSGPWECPDLVEVSGPDGERAWVLVVGVLRGGPGGGSGTQCFVGDFDGTRFTCRDPAARVCWLDHGRDWYAAQTFAGRDGSAPLALAWASNWQYANRTPTTAFRGALSLPRELSLSDGPDGWHIVARVPASVARAFDALSDDDFADVPEGDRRAATPRTGTWRTRLTLALVAGERVRIRLFGEEVPQIELDRVDPDGVPAVRLWRDARLSVPGADGVRRMDGFATDRRVRLDEPAITAGTRAPTVEVSLELFVDNGLVELCLLDGGWWATMLHFPADVAGPVEIERVDGPTNGGRSTGR